MDWIQIDFFPFFPLFSSKKEMLHIITLFYHLLQLLSALSSHLQVASTAVSSKVMVLLLLIHCLLLLPLFYGGSVFGSCFVIEYLVSFMMLRRAVVALLCVVTTRELLSVLTSRHLSYTVTRHVAMYTALACRAPCSMPVKLGH